MSADGGTKVLTTREKILFEGIRDWVKLDDVHEYVGLGNKTDSLAEVQRKTLDLVRSMAEEGVIALGNLIDSGANFADWDMPLDDAIAAFAAEYIDRFNDRTRWPWMLWLRVTDKGKEIGRSYADEYATWLADLRASGREYERPPLHLQPK